MKTTNATPAQHGAHTPMKKTVYHQLTEMLSDLGEDIGTKKVLRFKNGPGCGLANDKDGAHVVFRTVTGRSIAMTVTPSMIERQRWQWQLGEIEAGGTEYGSLVLDDHNTLDDAIQLLWMQHRGCLPPDTRVAVAGGDL